MSKPLDFQLSTVLVVISSLCLCLHSTEAAAVATNNVSARIVGGTPTNIASIPYIVNLRSRGRFFCGGTLVTPSHVVTAAHCVKGQTQSSITVVGGATTLSETGIRRSVRNMSVPNSFSMTSLHNDVAVLKLSSPMTGKNVGTAPLCTIPLNVGDLMQVSGWGVTNQNSGTVPNQVRTVKVPFISVSNCRTQYRGKAEVTSSMICASVPGSKDSCTGDSGGPGIVQGQFCGIVSWGIGCAQRNNPGVYTNVKKVMDFIQNAIKTL